jgi:hypothetical protein
MYMYARPFPGIVHLWSRYDVGKPADCPVPVVEEPVLILFLKRTARPEVEHPGHRVDQRPWKWRPVLHGIDIYNDRSFVSPCARQLMLEY